MGIPPLQAVALDLVSNCLVDRSRFSGPEIAQILQSAASAAECPIAILYLDEKHGFRVAAAFGVLPCDITPAGQRFLTETAHRYADGVPAVNDAGCRPGDDPGNHLSRIGLSAVRFVARLRVGIGPGDGRTGWKHGVLVVADVVPHADLSAAQLAILRAHAAEFSSRLELSRRQSETGWLHRLAAVAANGNDNRTAHHLPAGKISRKPSLWEPIEVKLLNSTNDGTEFWDELNIIPVSNEDGCYTRWVSVQPDVNRGSKAEDAPVRVDVAEARSLPAASHDPLTGRHDRACFLDRLNDALRRCRNGITSGIVVLFIDLVGFERACHDLGHRADDLLLAETELVQRLRSSVRPLDVVARLGNGEFALLVEAGDAMGFAAALAGRIIETTGRPLQIGGREIRGSCSIGVAYAGEHHDTAVKNTALKMLHDAEIAMHQAKRQGISSYVISTGSTCDDVIPPVHLPGK